MGLCAGNKMIPNKVTRCQLICSGNICCRAALQSHSSCCPSTIMWPMTCSVRGQKRCCGDGHIDREPTSASPHSCKFYAAATLLQSPDPHAVTAFAWMTRGGTRRTRDVLHTHTDRFFALFSDQRDHTKRKRERHGTREVVLLAAFLVPIKLSRTSFTVESIGCAREGHVPSRLASVWAAAEQVQLRLCSVVPALAVWMSVDLSRSCKTRTASYLLYDAMPNATTRRGRSVLDAFTRVYSTHIYFFRVQAGHFKGSKGRTTVNTWTCTAKCIHNRADEDKETP